MSNILSKEELTELLESILSVRDKKTGKELTEQEHFDLVVKFKRGINHPGGTDLIFYPEDVGLPKNRTIEEIVELALKGV